ncbi:MAG TPA: ELM1/GtrOC1 family putative glycosyltransferase [Synergistaceae bacterium]|nr:ELM1/GtrOC1 family putative glycosyltransferase [Synergistaceae bacterium]
MVVPWSKSGESGSPVVILLHDGITGHYNQSLGVAEWLADLGNFRVRTWKIPEMDAKARFMQHKIRALRLRHSSGKAPWGAWLVQAGGSPLLLEIMQWLVEEAIPYGNVLFLSAGSGAAPYCLCMARSIGARCCTLMTPSVLGTDPFDYALVPEHDDPGESPKVLRTLGAPNTLRRESLRGAARDLLALYPSELPRRWVFLVGGDDNNYSLSPEWVLSTLDPLVDHGVEQGAEIYLTTSRRTSRATEELLKKLLSNRRRVRMYLPASEQTFSPVAGMLGLATRVFCTEDSVSMISEAVTAGHRVRLVPGHPKNRALRKLQRGTEKLCTKKILPSQVLWGAPKFDRLFRAFEERGYLVKETGSFASMRAPDDAYPAVPEEFNEARRAARWLLERW